MQVFKQHMHGYLDILICLTLEEDSGFTYSAGCRGAQNAPQYWEFLFNLSGMKPKQVWISKMEGKDHRVVLEFVTLDN